MIYLMKFNLRYNISFSFSFCFKTTVYLACDHRSFPLFFFFFSLLLLHHHHFLLSHSSLFMLFRLLKKYFIVVKYQCFQYVHITSHCAHFQCSQFNINHRPIFNRLKYLFFVFMKCLNEWMEWNDFTWSNEIDALIRSDSCFFLSFAPISSFILSFVCNFFYSIFLFTFWQVTDVVVNNSTANIYNQILDLINVCLCENYNLTTLVHYWKGEKRNWSPLNWNLIIRLKSQNGFCEYKKREKMRID